MATKSDIFDSTLELLEAVSVATNQIPLTQSQDISQHKFCLDVGTFFKPWSWQQSQVTWLKVRTCSSWVCGNKTQYFWLNVRTISSRSCSKNVSAFISLYKGGLNILNHWNVWKNWPTERFNWDYLLEKLFHRQRLCWGETSQKQLQTLNTAPRPQCENSSSRKWICDGCFHTDEVWRAAGSLYLVVIDELQDDQCQTKHGGGLQKISLLRTVLEWSWDEDERK